MSWLPDWRSDKPMRIRHLETWQESLPLVRPYTIAFKSVEAVSLHFVRLATDSGLAGIGSAAPTDITGETSEACGKALSDIGPDLVVGRDPRQLPEFARSVRTALESSPSACAAIDMALHDLMARAAGKPLVEVLGRRHESLPTSITIGIRSLDDTLREAVEYTRRGFTVLKVKLGHDLQQDIERLGALRRHVGPEIRIRADANQGYNLEQTIRLTEQVARLRIEFIEQPLPAHATGAMRRLPASAARRMAADESLHSADDARRLAEPPHPFGIFNIKLMKCGGISAARDIARIARPAGIQIMWGCMDESAVSIAAALHAAYASAATRFLDLDGSFDLSRDAASGGFRLEGGRLHTLELPGLGASING